MNSAVSREVSARDKRRFLVFRIARRVYALPAETVVEVIRIPPTARVPQAPKALIGVANLRGVVLPIASLHALLGLEVEESADSRAIVLDGRDPVAVVVDAIDALVTIECRELVQTQTAQLSVEQGERVTGAFPLRNGQGAAKILDVQALLAEAFVRRTRPNHPNAVSGAIAIKAAEAEAERETFVSFDVAGQEFALALGMVQEVIALPYAITMVPRAGGVVAGVMAFRERLLPLLSMRELLGFAPAPVSEMREKILVASVGGTLVGLVADRARAVIAADPLLIDPVPAVIRARSGGEARIKSIYRGEQGRLVSILAPEQLFREDVMQRLGGDPQWPSSGRTPSGRPRQARSGKFLVFRLRRRTSSGLACGSG